MIPRGLHVHMAGESCPLDGCSWSPDTPSYSERLTKAEQERDRFIAAADKLHGEWLGLKAELVSARQETASVRNELGAARLRIEQLRAAQQWIVARDGGRDCISCEHEIRRGEAYELLFAVDELRHIHCPDLPLPDNQIPPTEGQQ